jgi:HEPN domain-containing protein
MANEQSKSAPGLFNFLGSFRLSNTLENREPEQEAGWPLVDAKADWAEALTLFQTGQYDQATPVFRRTVENLIKANIPGAWGQKSFSGDLLIIAKKAFGPLPPDIAEALIFLNPHCTLVKSVYNHDFACEIQEKARLVIRWVSGQRPSRSAFNPDIIPPRKPLR